MSGITLIVHQNWLDGVALDSYRHMAAQGVSVFVQKDLSAKVIALDDWLAGKRPPPVVQEPPTMAVIPKNTPRPRPYYQRGRW